MKNYLRNFRFPQELKIILLLIYLYFHLSGREQYLHVNNPGLIRFNFPCDSYVKTFVGMLHWPQSNSHSDSNKVI
jgi:hypothetical protein